VTLSGNIASSSRSRVLDCGSNGWEKRTTWTSSEPAFRTSFHIIEIYCRTFTHRALAINEWLI
jgi:hypothetical protein